MVGALVCHWHGRQKLEQMQQRLLRSEEARNGAIERSANARDQIAQLSKAISDMRKAHHTARSGAAGLAAAAAMSADERRAMAERALDAAAASDARSARSGKLVLFANTEPMAL